MSLFQHILIPTDFSQAAWNAVQLGIDLATSENSRITLLHVFPSSAKFSKTSNVEVLEDQKLIDTLQLQMDEFCSSLQKKTSVAIDPVIVKGKVEKEILSFIQKHEFDMVIMGVNSNGMDNQPGSHIANIIEKANAPVMIIPNQMTPVKVSA